MLEKVIEFSDYEGNKRSDTFYFNLNKAEVIMWLTTSGEYTLDKVLLKLSSERNGKKIMETFEDLIHRSYGKRTLNGIRFEKSEEIWLEFYQSEAYAELFTELVSDARKAAAFINGIIPESLASEINKTLTENKDGIPDEIKDYISNVSG